MKRIVGVGTFVLLVMLATTSCGHACDECSMSDSSYPRCEGDVAVACTAPNDPPCQDPILCPPVWGINAVFDHNALIRTDCAAVGERIGIAKRCAMAGFAAEGLSSALCVDRDEHPCVDAGPPESCPPDGHNHACLYIRDGSGTPVDDTLSPVCNSPWVCHDALPNFRCIPPPLVECDPDAGSVCAPDGGGPAICVGTPDAGYVELATPCPDVQSCDSVDGGAECVLTPCNPDELPRAFCAPLGTSDAVIECRRWYDGGYLHVDEDCSGQHPCSADDAGNVACR